jgi:hypothetical protein
MVVVCLLASCLSVDALGQQAVPELQAQAVPLPSEVAPAPPRKRERAADTPAPLPSAPLVDISADLQPAEVPPIRPRMTLAIGMGASFESAGLGRTEAVPAFSVTGGVGADWRVGVELAAFASSATGRFKAPDAPIDRLALSLIGVARPFAWVFPVGDHRYGVRVLRTFGLEAGPGVERDGSTQRAGSRWGLHTGVRLEVPIVPATSPSELRIRIGGRYMYGFYTPRVGPIEVGNGAELYAALVTVF